MLKKVKNIADGDKGIDQTVAEMWRLINRDTSNRTVRKYASDLLKTTSEDTIKATFDYVWKKVPYVSDPETAEQLTAPIHLLTGEKVGEDCDGMVMLLATLLLINKIEVRIRTIAWRVYQFTHVVLDAKLNGEWIGLDATRKSSGYNFKMNTIREKIYNNPMAKLITLEDRISSNCGCKKRPQNQNIINIGNTEKSFYSDDDYIGVDNNNFDGKQRITKLQPETQVVEKIVQVPVEKKVIIPIPPANYKTKKGKFFPAYY